MTDSISLPRHWLRWPARVAVWLVRALVLVVLVLVVLWGTLHFLIVPRIDVFRPWLLEQAQQHSGLRLELDAMEVRSNGLVPEVALRGLRLLDAQGATALALPEVHVAFSSASLLLGRVGQINVQGADLEVRRDPQGQIWVAGLLVQSPDQQDSVVLDWLFDQEALRVEGGRVRWVDALRAAPPLDFTGVSFLMRNAARNHDLRLDATPPPHWGEPIHLSGSFSRALLASHPGRLADWRGQLHAELPRIDLALLAPYLEPARGIRSAHGKLQAWLDVREGQVTGSTVDLALADVDASIDGHGQALQLRQLAGRVVMSPVDGAGVQYAVKGLQGQARDGLIWPASDLTLRLWPAGSAGGAHGSVAIEQLDLALAAQLAARMPVAAATHTALAQLQPAGQVHALAVQWQGPWNAPTDYRVKARLQQLRLAAYGAAGFPGIGVEGMDAEIDASPTGGSSIWKIKKGALALPLVLDEGRVPLDEASATLRWSWQEGRLRLEMQRLQFANPDLAGELAMVWTAPRVPGGTASGGAAKAVPGLGELALDSKLSRLQPGRLTRYLPSAMDRDVRNYLRDAFSGGELGPVTVKVKGDLDQFPFSNGRTGTFQIATSLRNMNYAYALAPSKKGAPSWPTLAQLFGDLEIDRDTLVLSNARANWLHPAGAGAGVPIARATARISHLYDHATANLSLEGRSVMSDALAVINRSAVGPLMGNALARTSVSGAAAYKINLQIPIADPAKTTLQGNLALPGNDFQYSPESPKVVRVRGTLGFSENSVNLSGVQASALGGDVRLDGTLQFSEAAWTAGGNRVRVQGTLSSSGLRESKDLGALAALAGLLDGQTAYAADIGWRGGAPQVQITSDLQGMALALPPPLGKSAASALPLRLEWSGAAGESGAKPSARSDTIRMTLGRAAQAVLQRDTSGAEPRLQRGVVALGETDAAPALPAQGLQVQIDTAVLDVDQWSRALQPLLPEPEGLPATGSPYMPNAVKVQVKQLLWDGRHLDRLNASARREGGLWRVDVDAAQLAGKLEFSAASGGSGSRLQARLSRLSLEASAANDVQTLLDAPATSLPAMDVVVDALEMYGKKLGRMQALAVNVGTAAGKAEWRLQQLQLTVPEATFNATGVWGSLSSASAPSAAGTAQATPRKVPGDSRRTELNFKLDVADAGALLARFGMVNVVRAGSGKIEGSVGWAAPPLNLDYPSMSGRMNLDIAKGQFLRADPGVAKLLGVLSLQSLPRRLMLDFRDVFSDGFEFNYVRGDVAIEQGVARSNNLQMLGAVATVLMDGSTDIARETQSIKVLVVPQLDTGTATLLTAIANPLAGLYTLVASTLLRQPIQDANTQELLVEGSWQVPRVSKIDRRTGKPLPQ